MELHGCDLSRGHVCGTMCANDVPSASSPIITWWDGEVIDGVHHTFFTHKWGASRETDMQHWARFEGFAELSHEVARQGGRCSRLRDAPSIYM